MTLTKARIQELHDHPLRDMSSIEQTELCRLAIANLETQEWCEERANMTGMPESQRQWFRNLLTKLRGSR